jgi:hypothetical protein
MFIVEEFPDYEKYPNHNELQRIDLELVDDRYYIGQLQTYVYNSFVRQNRYRPFIIIDVCTMYVIGISSNYKRFLKTWEEYEWTFKDKVYHGVSGEVHVTVTPVKKIKKIQYD